MQKKTFTSWTSWDARNELPSIKLPGVYAIAISKRRLCGKPFEWRKEIVYIGMTIATSGLRGRLKQFDNTVRGKSGHGGADRVRYKYPKYEQLEPNLCVAVCSFRCNPKGLEPSDWITMGKVVQFEFQCIAQFLTTFRRLPEFNNRNKSPKFSRIIRKVRA